jgi:hypothetical protein
MLSAANAASSALDMLLQSLGSSKSSSANSTGFGQKSSDPFDLFSGTAMSGNSTAASGLEAFSQISPAMMSALFAAQSQSLIGSAAPAATGKPEVPNDLFSQLDANGDGQVTKSEFENGLGAGATNIANAAAASSRNFMDQMIARQMQAFASSSSAWMSF